MPTLIGKDAMYDANVAITKQLDGGVFEFWAGQAPQTPDTPITNQTLLAELRFSSPAFQTPVYGEGPMPGDIFDSYNSMANPITPDTDANATGTPTFFRCRTAAGRGVIQGSVTTGGGGGGDVVVDFTSITIHGVVALQQFWFTTKRSCQ